MSDFYVIVREGTSPSPTGVSEEKCIISIPISSPRVHSGRGSPTRGKICDSHQIQDSDNAKHCRLATEILMQDTGNKRRVRAHICICNRARLAQFPKYCAKGPSEVRLRRIRASAQDDAWWGASLYRYDDNFIRPVITTRATRSHAFRLRMHKFAFAKS